MLPPWDFLHLGIPANGGERGLEERGAMLPGLPDTNKQIPQKLVNGGWYWLIMLNNIMVFVKKMLLKKSNIFFTKSKYWLINSVK